MMPQRSSWQPGSDDRPLGELFGDMSRQVQDLLRKEVELAKIETKEEMAKAGKAGAMFGAAAVAGFVALLLLAFAAAWGLAEAIPAGLAFLAVGLLFAVVGGILAVQGRKKLETFEPVPQQAVRSIGQDVSAAKESLSRGANAPLQRPVPRSRNG